MDVNDKKRSASNLRKVRQTNAQEQNAPTEAILRMLARKFGHKEFRPLQWDILTALVEQQRDVIAVMATGYGKSLCYQFPSVYSDGLTIVISPLMSLMQDQATNLQLSNIAACFLGTTENKKVIEDILLNKYRIAYLTPQFCTTNTGTDFLAKICKNKLHIELVAIDEAHCVSSWSHDFRPHFQSLDVIRHYFPKVPILALTTIATPKLVTEIARYLTLKNPLILYTGLDRPNLFFGVQRKTNQILKDLHKVMIMKNGRLQFSGPTIIYCITREETEDVKVVLNRNRHRSLLYHFFLRVQTRKSNLRKFLNNEVDVLVVLITSRISIDKPDIRNVIHYGCSGSLEAYYQEIGRAGRDGLPARCTIFYNDLEFEFQQRLTYRERMDIKQLKKDLLHDFLKTDSCRREHILEYFEDVKGTEVSNTINCCDNCVKRLSGDVSDYEAFQYDRLYDFTADAKIILNAIEQMGTYNSTNMVSNFVCGKVNKNTMWHQDESYFGAGKNHKMAWWKAAINLFMENGYIREHDAKNAQNLSFKSLSVSEKGKNLLKTAGILYLTPSDELLDLLKPKPCRRRWIVNNKEDKHAANKNNEPSTSLDFEATVLQLNKILVKTRDDVAKILKCRVYSIATNSAIMELARKMPLTTKEFQDAEIVGINKDKLPKFAYYFVKAIRGFCFNEKPSLRDVLLEEPRVARNTKLDVGLDFTYNLYKNKCSVKDIALCRNLTEASVEEQLINCLKLGYDISLSVFGINQEIFYKIKNVFDTNGGYGYDEMPAAAANLLHEFSDLQKVAVFWYVKIRKNLHDLRIDFEEFDEFDCTSTEADLLGMLVQGLENEPTLSNCDDDKENSKRNALNDGDDDEDGPPRKIQNVNYLKEQNQNLKPFEMLLAAAEHLEKYPEALAEI